MRRSATRGFHATKVRRPAKVSRRQAIAVLGSVGAIVAAGCSSSTPTSPSTTTTGSTGTTGTGTTGSGTCAVAPNETIGPYPSLTDMVRSDIREGRAGVSLVLTIKVVNTNANCAPVSGAAVEIWQCDATGNYSQYGTQAGFTYLRGIQTTNAGGEVTFTTIYPGWYQGRATHIHVEVVVGGRSVKVTQIAFPESISSVVHATLWYGNRGSNPTTNLQDNIFADSLSEELVTPAGSTTDGYAATFQCGIAL
ncbi:MAG: intradiol ring-cleavage dioxygenase [Acidobacteria bacterium]|nr:intradiol ring-cleavage dioxygenase [Acidobacteriota bacterium]